MIRQKILFTVRNKLIIVIIIGWITSCNVSKTYIKRNLFNGTETKLTLYKQGNFDEKIKDKKVTVGNYLIIGDSILILQKNNQFIDSLYKTEDGELLVEYIDTLYLKQTLSKSEQGKRFYKKKGGIKCNNKYAIKHK